MPPSSAMSYKHQLGKLQAQDVGFVLSAPKSGPPEAPKGPHSWVFKPELPPEF